MMPTQWQLTRASFGLALTVPRTTPIARAVARAGWRCESPSIARAERVCAQSEQRNLPASYGLLLRRSREMAEVRVAEPHRFNSSGNQARSRAGQCSVIRGPSSETWSMRCIWSSDPRELVHHLAGLFMASATSRSTVAVRGRETPPHDHHSAEHRRPCGRRCGGSRRPGHRSRHRLVRSIPHFPTRVGRPNDLEPGVDHHVRTEDNHERDPNTRRTVLRTEFDAHCAPHVAHSGMCHRSHDGLGRHVAGVGDDHRRTGKRHPEREQLPTELCQWNGHECPGDRGRIQGREWRLPVCVGYSICKRGDQSLPYSDDQSERLNDHFDDDRNEWPFIGSGVTAGFRLGRELTASSCPRSRQRLTQPDQGRCRKPET